MFLEKLFRPSPNVPHGFAPFNLLKRILEPKSWGILFFIKSLRRHASGVPHALCFRFERPCDTCAFRLRISNKTCSPYIPWSFPVQRFHKNLYIFHTCSNARASEQKSLIRAMVLGESRRKLRSGFGHLFSFSLFFGSAFFGCI